MNKTGLTIVKDFIYNDTISNSIEKINQNFLDFNILEITGMGTQEIKHSNILEWILGDNQHNLKDKVLIELLKKIYKENNVDDDLQKYIYLTKDRKINVYRERSNIDLIVEDVINKKLFVFENKIFADERTNGEDGGQLKKYENIVFKDYPQNEKDSFDIYFIYLTPSLKNPSREKWLKASYQMIVEVLEKILKEGKLYEHTKIVLSSYIDLLVRRHVVENEELKKLCTDIWNNPDYKNALEILYSYKPDKISFISEYLQEKVSSFDKIRETDSSKKYIRFYDPRQDTKEQNEGIEWTKDNKVLLFEFQNTTNGLILKYIIGPSSNNEFREKIHIHLKSNSFFTPGNSLFEKWNPVWSSENILSYDDLESLSNNEIKDKINEWFEKFFLNDGNYDKINSYITSIIK